MNRRIFAVAMAAVAALIVGSRDAARRWAGPSAPRPSIAPAPSVVEDLDRCIQTRFEDDIKNFGIMRLVVAPEHFRGFQPETPDETAALSRLRSEGIRMAFYLGSRQGLALHENEEKKPEPPEERGLGNADDDVEGEAMEFRPAVSGAIYVTDPKGLADVPWPRELVADVRKALVVFETSDTYSRKHGPWTIEARPLRATKQSCLKCHSVEQTPIPGGEQGKFSEKPLKLGDTLGIAFYVYKRPEQ